MPRTRVASLALLLTLALMLLPAAVASAEPDFSATLSGANPRFTWESSGTGVTGTSVPDLSGGSRRCTGAPFTCEYILLDVEVGGDLKLTLDGTDDGDVSDPTGVCPTSPCASAKDIDGFLCRSNAAGEPVGKALTNDCLTVSSSETCKIAVGPGFYVVEVEYFLAVEAHYIGTAELAATPGPPVAEPQMVTLDDCNFSLYYFKDSAERLQALVPPGYRVRPYPGSYVASTPPLPPRSSRPVGRPGRIAP